MEEFERGVGDRFGVIGLAGGATTDEFLIEVLDVVFGWEGRVVLGDDAPEGLDEVLVSAALRAVNGAIGVAFPIRNLRVDQEAYSALVQAVVGG